MPGDGIQADLVEVVDGGAEADGGDDRRSAGLEFCREVGRFEAVERDAADHASAAQEGRHRFQQFAPPVENANAGGPHHFMPAEGEEIGVQGLHVDLQMRHALGPIDEDTSAGLVCLGDDFSDWVDRAEHVGHGRHRYEPGLFAQQRVEGLDVESALFRDRHVANGRAGPLSQLAPGNEVGVVLHLGEQDFVAAADVCIAPASGHEVDRRGRPVREDDLRWRGRVDQRADFFPRLLVKIGRLVGEPMDAAVDVGVMLFVGFDNRLDDLARPLGRGGVVEVDQRDPAVEHLGKDREVAADRLRIKAWGAACCVGHESLSFPPAPSAGFTGENTAD